MTKPIHLRFAVIGDAEPKPDPIFVNLGKAVDVINRLHAEEPLAFTAGVGDIAHQGRVEQYEAATEHLQKLMTPFHAIMGNEELMGGKEHFFRYARLWNQPGQRAIEDIRDVITYADVAFIFATAEDGGHTFSEDEVRWIEAEVLACDPRPVFLFTHAACPGVFPEADHRSMKNDLLQRVLTNPRLKVVFSGHTHMDPDIACTYAQDEHGVNHVHIPGLERTKIGDRHVPRFRLVEIKGGDVLVRTYNLEADGFEAKHDIAFLLC